MQFEVAVARLEAEFGVRTTLEHLPYEVVRRTDPAGEELLRTVAGAEVLTRVRDGALLALFTSNWRMRAIADNSRGLALADLL
ncbi:hypothetical protein [Plantactinospora sp. KBS50]|uniref:hypothetical protein n=1 Tax=Plantactinospora sp. KBS50 TaxID=2024580 RepID=UPI001E563D00|nr:hypothetical protein [Plantactinospora sp. KBS50]